MQNFQRKMTENHFTINTEKLNPVLLFKISGLLRRYAPRNDGEMSTAPKYFLVFLIYLFSVRLTKLIILYTIDRFIPLWYIIDLVKL